jgi:hypothetical protein
MKDLFLRLEKAIGALAVMDSGTTDVTAETAPETVNMTVEKFVEWVTGQVELAKADAADIRKARLIHVAEQVRDVRKGFEGVTPTPGGILAVKPFMDPGQVKTTSTTVSPGAQATDSAFAQNPVPPAVNGAGNTPPGGMMPPPPVTSGFSTFAKSLDSLAASIDALTAQPAASEETTTDAKEPAEDVHKGRVVWPMNMSSDFGMGKIEDPETPEWGFDDQPVDR